MLIKNNLTAISAPIKDELKKFNELYKSSMKSKVALVDLVTGYILRQKGKKIRPLLVLLSAKLAGEGEVSDRSFRGAILVEILHSATLIHDDVVDGAEKRRGFPSINAIWKNKVAVLMGDYLLARGLTLSVDGKDYDFLGTVTDTVKRMSEGELLQISKTRKLNIDEETYFKIISDKTASLLSTCCVIGASSVTDSEDDINNLHDYGEYLGIAFQIRDDILDYVGSTKVFGKPKGGDIREKKITLPLIYALQKADPKRAKEVRKKLKKGPGDKEVSEIIEFVNEMGGIDYAEKVAFEYADKAINCLKTFPESEIKDALQTLVDFVVKRSK